MEKLPRISFWVERVSPPDEPISKAVYACHATRNWDVPSNGVFMLFTFDEIYGRDYQKRVFWRGVLEDALKARERRLVREVRPPGAPSPGRLFRRRNLGAGVIVDRLGHTFGRLTVIARAPSGTNGARWQCRCLCNQEKIVAAADLVRGAIKSCGCLRRESGAMVGRRNACNDILGKRFGRLVAATYRSKGIWRCRCDCGSEKLAHRQSLILGQIKSCGCYRRSRASRLNLAHGHTRNRAPTSEYVIWRGMKQRCLAPKNISYRRYGGRGIKVCARWLNGDGIRSGYECFFADMGKRPSRYHSIDRRDNDGNYEPSNCRWATAIEQQNNKSRSGISPPDAVANLFTAG